MTIKFGLQARVHDVRGFKCRRHKGDIGIEVELEGSFTGLKDTYWTWKEEGSLRNGMEFVLHHPVTRANLPKALDDFEAMMKGSTVIKSIRCSTHMHVNIEEFTMEALYNAITAYYLLEEVLVRSQGSVRTGNLFCLRMSDAEHISHDLRVSVKDSAYILDFSQNEHKYGALNLGAPGYFGSLEFRFLLPMTDKAELEFWALLLLDLVQNASKIPSIEQVRMVEKSPMDFAREVIGEVRIKKLLGMLPSPGVLEELVYTNLDHIIKIANLIENEKVKKKFKLPKHLWEPDLVNDEMPKPGKKGSGNPTNNPFLNTVAGDEAIASFVAQVGAAFGNEGPTVSPASLSPPPPPPHPDWTIVDDDVPDFDDDVPDFDEFA